jgi:hypothetical protein
MDTYIEKSVMLTTLRWLSLPRPRLRSERITCGYLARLPLVRSTQILGCRLGLQILAPLATHCGQKGGR